MWNLKRLAAENYRDHLEIAFPPDSPPPSLSTGEIDVVMQFYDRYVERLGRPSADLLGNETPPVLQQQVHDAYSFVQDGRRLGSLRSAIKLLADECPYCGYGPIEDLDHLLQRGQYKLFSIFALNLVPACATCNRGKRKTPTENPGQHQIHVYLEDLSEYEFLKVAAAIDLETGGLRTTYLVDAPETMPADVRDRLAHHIADFDLQNRYQKQVNIFLGEHEYTISSSFADGGRDALRRWLYGTADALRKRFGVNDWRTALVRGLAECDAFCEGGFRTALGLQPAVSQEPAASALI